MRRPVESASLFPAWSKFIVGGNDMWVRLFDFDTGDEIGKCSESVSENICCSSVLGHNYLLIRASRWNLTNMFLHFYIVFE